MTTKPIHPRILRLAEASRLDGFSSEEQEIRRERSAAAAAHFHQLLTPAQRDMLIRAASASNMLFLALGSGDWENAVRTLRGYVARAIPKKDWPEYRELIVALNVQTPLSLETSGHRQVVHEDDEELAGAAA